MLVLLVTAFTISLKKEKEENEVCNTIKYVNTKRKRSRGLWKL